MKPLLILFSLCLVLLARPSIQKAHAQDETPLGNLDATTQIATSDPNSLLDESRRGLWLVQAECLSIAQDAEQIARWKIDQVFNGPQTMKNKEFAASNYRQNFAGNPFPFAPDVNEEALWVVRFQNEQVVTLYGLTGAYGVFFPVGQNHLDAEVKQGFSDYGEVVEYARLVEHFVKAERREQIRLLNVYAKSLMPHRSTWAIYTLASSDLEHAPQFLLGLAGETPFSIERFLILDEALEDMDKRKKVQWNRSEARFNLWRRLVTSPAAEKESDAIITRLDNLGEDEAKQRDQAVKEKTVYVPALGGARLFEWFHLAGANEKWMPKPRAAAIASIGRLSRNEQIGRSWALEYLLLVLKDHPDFAQTSLSGISPSAKTNAVEDELAVGAIRGLGAVGPLTGVEINTLRALLMRARSVRLRISLYQISRK